MHAYSRAMGRDERWRVYTPPCYAQQTARRYPVLYLLHGGEHNDEHWDDIGIDTAADALIASGAIPPLLIVLPDGGQDFGPLSGSPPPFADFMQSTLIPQIDRDERTLADRDHRRLGGISYGAAWALLLAARFPELWSAVGAHSPAIGSFNGIEPDAAALARGHVRAYLDVGDRDGLRKPTETFASQLKQAGADFELHIFAGRHTDAYWRAHLADYLHFYTAGW